MDEYKKPYLILWRGIENAIAAIRNQNFGLAGKLLEQAQAEAEEEYISAGENR